MWDEQARALGSAFRVLRYDQRGHGATEAPAGRYTFDLLIADAHRADGRARDQQGAFRRPVHGRRHRARPRAATSRPARPGHRLRLAVPVDADERPAMGGAHRRRRRSRAWRPWSSPRSGAGFPRRCSKANPPHIDKVRQMIRTTPVNGFIGCAAALADHDYAAAVATVTRPVLFMVGEKDGVTPRRHAQAQRGAARLALRGACRRRAHFQPRPARGFHPRHRAISCSRLMSATAAPDAAASLQISGRQLYLRARRSTPGRRRRASIAKPWAFEPATPPLAGRSQPKSAGENVMTAAAAAKRTAPAGLSNKAREMMEAINAEAGKHNVWVRTQANAPAQRPWFSETGGEGSGQLASGRVAANQMKTLPHMWRWKEYSPYLHQHLRDRPQGRRVADRVRRPPEHSAAQSGIERPAAGHQHHPLRDLDLQSRRRRAGASALAQRQPHHPVGQGRLHRRRRRALHRRARRPDPDAERHLARPRQRCRASR